MVTKDLADPSTTSLGNSRSIRFETLVPERKCPYKHCKDFPLQVMAAEFWNSCIRKKRPLASFAFGENKIVNFGCEMAQRVMARTTKLDDLSSSPGTHG